MKTESHSMSTAKASETPRATKPLRRSSKSKAKHAISKSTSSRGLSTSLADHGQQAQNLLGRGKSALRRASSWAETTTKRLPTAARDLDIPGKKVAMDFVEQRPLVVGVLGLGIGLVIGTIIPRMSTPSTTRRRN